mmetsp:Transcript_23694/g.68175  ORF Transcript_23694/g.68175 Transcript_23694/m.68175 type:complete len:148 (+) Transcript_23694:322-765(+)|eukprot:CAMPEP_0181052878 /NCGR_PEP_ID=MMETSP1070-20121207/17819_1 /TAXON_ID=265543 /ORGANISM="Minutocellus polymorphus, Strain NH13" /LENGTH=147 /DNA_ID=CAMNT_0023131989 /DNA_START=268 /DNA_END=711 /DNA_ORIENTATION=+
MAPRVLKRLPYKKPTKPASGYNIFYKGATSRARNREKAERKYAEKILLTVQSDSSPASSNKTKLIGGQWKGLQPHSRDLFSIRSKDELEVYHMSKALWGVLERLLQPLQEDEAKAAKMKEQRKSAAASTDFVALRKHTNEHLVHFLS